MGTPNSLRHAALALHALDEGDRNWLLERIHPGSRRSLVDLLAELGELGIPRDARLVEDVLAQGATAKPSPMQELAGVSASQAWLAIASEPLPIQQRCLACLDGASRQAVLAEVHDTRQRSRLTMADENFLIAPALRAALLVAWRTRAAAQVPVAAGVAT